MANDPYVTREDHELYSADAARIQADRRTDDRSQPVTVRCEPCCGTGIKGRWRHTARGRAWKIGTCAACRGTGQQDAPRRRKESRR